MSSFIQYQTGGGGGGGDIGLEAEKDHDRVTGQLFTD